MPCRAGSTTRSPTATPRPICSSSPCPRRSITPRPTSSRPSSTTRALRACTSGRCPLSIRAVLQLGNLCTIDESQQGVLGKGLDQGFDLPSLKRPARPRDYLESISMAYIYISHISAGERQIFGLFSTTSDQAHVVILHKNKDGAQEMPNIGKMYADMLARRVEEAAGADWQKCFRYQDKISFKVTQVTTRRKALLEISDTVKRMRRDEASRPQMVVIQSSQRNQLLHDVPILGELPVLPLRYDPRRQLAAASRVADCGRPTSYGPLLRPGLLGRPLHGAGEVRQRAALQRRARRPEVPDRHCIRAAAAEQRRPSCGGRPGRVRTTAATSRDDVVGAAGQRAAPLRQQPGQRFPPSASTSRCGTWPSTPSSRRP